MNTIKELKEYCLERISHHAQLEKSAELANHPISEASNQGSNDAFKDIHDILVINFKDKDSQWVTSYIK